MKIVFALSALLLLAAVPANAKGKGKAKGGDSFAQMDTNSDGKISLEEFKAAGKTEEAFKALDTNGDGSLSPDELKGGATKKKKK